jgi:hypothetical protein
MPRYYVIEVIDQPAASHAPIHTTYIRRKLQAILDIAVHAGIKESVARAAAIKGNVVVLRPHSRAVVFTHTKRKDEIVADTAKLEIVEACV